MSAPFGWSEGRRPLNLEAGPSPLMTSPCPHDRETAPPTAAQVERALGAAAARVAAAGDRLTRPRRRVLELLLIAGSPAKAYDLVATYHREARVAKPATVYRALQFLETRGLVHRLSTLKSYVACDPERPGAPALYLLCDCCGSCREVPAPDLAALNAAATAAGYEIERITLEGQGLCPACRPQRPGAARDLAPQTEPEAAAGVRAHKH